MQKASRVIIFFYGSPYVLKEIASDNLESGCLISILWSAIVLHMNWIKVSWIIYLFFFQKKMNYLSFSEICYFIFFEMAKREIY